MTDSHPQRGLDWTKVHDFVVEKTSNVVEGFSTDDVNWFLRDSNVPLADGAHIPTSNEAETRQNRSNSNLERPIDLKGNAPSSESSASEAHTLPKLQTQFVSRIPVLNTNENSSNKTKPTISAVLEEEVKMIHNISPQAAAYPNRRGSVASIASNSSNMSNSSSTNGGSFFSKLKNRLQRSESYLSSLVIPTSPPRAESDSEYPFSNEKLFDSSKYSKEFQAQVSRSNSLYNPKIEEEFPDDPKLLEYVKFYRHKNERAKLLSSRCYIPSANPQVIQTPPPPAQQPSRISFLRRKSNQSNALDNNPGSGESIDTLTSLNSALSEEMFSPEFKNLKPLKHVAFHSLTFLIDPPQQIPSRTPRKGNVEVLPSGIVRVNPLSEADKADIERSLKGLGGGLVVGGTGALGYIHDKELRMDKADAQSAMSPSDLEVETSPDDELSPEEARAKTLSIDKPMIHAKSQVGYTVPVKKMALDLMYMRCCHLREILPIPAISKQIPKGSMAPLPVLQFRNPTPTMIEIETFADFIRIAPIISIYLDGVSLSYEQFKILLSAMCAKTQLEKLSLRNTPIDAEGWSLLCWFLTRNKAINRLDITQCPPLSILKKKKKKKPEEDAIVRMVCNKENRSDMDWTLFTASIIARGGIEELILTGCCITDGAVFETLINRAVCLKTSRLGLAYNQLSPQQFRVVLDSWVQLERSRGLDLGYNDLLSLTYMNIMLELAKKGGRQSLGNCKLEFLSLNATNLRFNETFKEVCTRFLCALPRLKFLDVSNNSKLFGNFNLSASPLVQNEGFESTDSPPENGSGVPIQAPTYTAETIASYFFSKLPTFENLIRLHLENNGLSGKSLQALFEVVPFCKSLVYLSINGNKLDIYSATALVQGIKNSTTLVTVDNDYLELPELFKEKVGLYSIRNMERFYNKTLPKPNEPEEGDEFQESLTEQMTKLLRLKEGDNFNLNSPEVAQFIKKLQSYRKGLKEAINDLFVLQYNHELTIDGKEALIRFLFIESSLERGLKMVDSSLVDVDETLTSADIINMNLPEDETSDSKINTQQKVLADHSDLLMPVGSNTLPISRTHSLTNLSTLNKEEGTVMKIGSMKKNLSFLDELDNCSGEDLRKKLLSVNLSDLDVLMEYINKARNKGVCLRRIFNEQLEQKSAPLPTPLLEVRQKLEKLKNAMPGKRPNAPLAGEKSQEMDHSYSSDEIIKDEDIAASMSEAYDRILSKFNK